MFVGLAGVQRGRLVRFMAKESVFRSRLSGPLMRGMRHLPVDRAHGELAARQALRALRAGEIVGVYPEATIGRAFVVKDQEDFRRGAAYLALATGAPLVPVAHWGIHRILTVDGRWSVRRGRAVSCVVGEPLVPLPAESPEALTTRLHDVLAEMVDELVATLPAGTDGPGRRMVVACLARRGRADHRRRQGPRRRRPSPGRHPPLTLVRRPAGAPGRESARSARARRSRPAGRRRGASPRRAASGRRRRPRRPRPCPRTGRR